MFCIDKSTLIQIFWGGTTNDRMRDLISKFLGKYSFEEIYNQMESNSGEVGEYIISENKRFSTITANDEIANALTLADIYFPKTESQICFKMKSSFGQGKINTYEELLVNMESDTEIDFSIQSTKEAFKFQLKQYPEEYKEWSVEKVIDYLEKKILPNHKYNNESNKELIIVITIKPKLKSNFKEGVDFDAIYTSLHSKDIKLKEINFLYNRNNENMVWYQVYPENGHCKIPFDQLSYHEAKK